MKVTVCFGSVRIVVPCGEGDFKVRDLINKAISRYKKATDQPSDCLVTVYNLHQLDGGILDPDDCLQDVADDREQLIAIYEETGKLQQGDGTSASEGSETETPNMLKCMEHKFEPFSRNGIEITGEELSATPPPLHVRRGSEPALNRLSPIAPYTTIHLDPSKRWSAAPVIDDHSPQSSTPLKPKASISLPYEDVRFEEYPGERGEGSGEEKNPSSSSSSTSSHHSSSTSTFKRFSRDANRCSIQMFSDNCGSVWKSQAFDRAVGVSECYSGNEGAQIETRKEPLGGVSTPKHSRDHSFEDPSYSSGVLVCLKNDGTPLGIHVIPSVNSIGKEQGLLVEGIESDGRVARDGRISLHDIIIEINGRSLKSINFQQAQEIFKAAMMDPELRLTLHKNDKKISALRMFQVQERLYGSLKMANVTQTKKTPISLSSRTQAVMLHSNTRKIGKRLFVKLKKGSHGLGFSITTRDNPAGGEAPIYIKNILPKGAAIEEGTLKIGDRLLEVNGAEVTGLCQSDVANLLRQIAIGSVASLVISRQEKIVVEQDVENVINNTLSPSPKLPRQLPSERILEDSFMFPWKQREILTFEIPVHDSERAGLGVSVKGKTSSGPNGSVDLGIFVKNVIHGGAASRDGRLRQNDQLVNINGLSLLGKSNSEAMKTLRTAMHQEVPTPGKITLLVARRIEGNQKDLKYFNSPLSHENSKFKDSYEIRDSLNIKKGHEVTTNIKECVDYGSIDTGQLNNNPFIYRLKGNNLTTLRNESYYKATHETWNSTYLNQVSPLEENQPLNQEIFFPEKFSSPTINAPATDTVLIHDEYGSNFSERIPSPQEIVPATSVEGIFSEAHTSLTSLDESGTGFSRDQFGRQSMSEKRHAALDAKNTDTYQRNKKAREERERSKKLDVIADLQVNGISLKRNKSSKEVGPGLGMRKSSSLESLQTLMQEIALEEEHERRESTRAPRGRGCNESFRAAVDRSYDAPTNSTSGNQMETLTEEESESSGSGFGRGNSRQSSVNSSAEEKLKKRKKRQKILKGLGSMFRFGKPRKGLEAVVPNLVEESSLEAENLQASVVKEKFGSSQQERNSVITDNDFNLHNLSSVTLSEDGSLTRSEKMHQLRAEHRRKHAKRNGAYPTDDLEEHYDLAVKKVVDENSEQHLAKENISNLETNYINTFDSHDFSEKALINSKEKSNILSFSLKSVNPVYSVLHATQNQNNVTGNPKIEMNINQPNSDVFCVDCIEAPRDSFKTPNCSNNILVNNQDVDPFLCNNRSSNLRHSLHIEVNHMNEISSSLLQRHLKKEKLIPQSHKTLLHKPPLPPKKQSFSNNYGKSLDYNLDPKSVLSVKFVPSDNSVPSYINRHEQKNCLESVEANFALTLFNPIPSCPYSIQSNGFQSYNTDVGNKVDKSTFDKKSQNILSKSPQKRVSYVNSSNLFSPIKGNGIISNAFKNIENTPLNSFDCNGKTDFENISFQPINNVNHICQDSSTQINSAQCMGLKNKTFSKCYRIFPGPSPIPPPKGLPNALAPLKSTEVLDRSQFWRMETLPVEPKAEIEHVRSRSFDFYGDSKESSLQAKISDRNKFSHYVNYEQIQMHLRKNMEQERLAKLASQQYQDFREKQTRRGFHCDQFSNQNLISKLEQKFKNESVLARLHMKHGIQLI